MRASTPAMCTASSLKRSAWKIQRAGYQKISDGEVEYTISDLSVVLENNSLGSGQSEGYTALVEIHLEVPVRFLGNLLPAASMTLHTEAKYVPSSDPSGLFNRLPQKNVVLSH